MNLAPRFTVKVLVFAAAIATMAISLWLYETFSVSEVLFCEGQDSLGEMQSVRFVDNGEDRAPVRVVQVASGKEELRYKDGQGLVFRETPASQASRVSVKISETEKLQVYRECGAQPVCRFERVRYLTPGQLAAAKKKAEAMELATFEARKKASMTANEFSVLRSQAIDLQKKIKKSKSEKEKQKLTVLYQQVETEAGEVANRMHGMEADTFNMQKQTEAMKQQLQENGTQVQASNLVPSQAERWCGNSARPKMKF